MPSQRLSHAQTGGRAAEVSRVSSISAHAHGTPISVTQNYSSDGITMQSPPLGPYPDLHTQPNSLQLDVPHMPENLTGCYPESTSCQFRFSNSHYLVTGSPPPLGMVNVGSAEHSPGPYVPPVQTQTYQMGFWAPMVNYNASQQTAILPAIVPVSTGVQGRAVPLPTDLEVPSGVSISGGSVFTSAADHAFGQTPPVHHQPNLTGEPSTLGLHIHTTPDKNPAAEFEDSPHKLQELCRRHGGSTFALDWITTVFMYGVTKEALVRALSRKEVDEMSFSGGFEPRQAFDGFISKVGDYYECGLCKDGQKVYWKYKKDAPRHLRKFHFGLADLCKSCGKGVYSIGEMRSHRCWPVSMVSRTSGATQ